MDLLQSVLSSSGCNCQVSQRPRTLSRFQQESKGQSPWPIFCCLPRHIGRELGQKQSRWDSKWCTDMGCQCLGVLWYVGVCVGVFGCLGVCRGVLLNWLHHNSVLPPVSSAALQPRLDSTVRMIPFNSFIFRKGGPDYKTCCQVIHLAKPAWEPTFVIQVCLPLGN